MVERICKIGRMKKIIQTVFIFVVLYSFMACTTDHSFTLDEKRQIIVVHNLLILEIESDSSQIDDGHLFFITKKDPYETRRTDTIRLQGTTTEISIEEIDGVIKALEGLKEKIKNEDNSDAGVQAS